MGTCPRVGWRCWAELGTVAGPAGHSVSSGPAEVSWAVAQPLTASPSGWTRRGPRVHSGPRSGVSLEAPGNKRPLPFWVLVSMATL